MLLSFYNHIFSVKNIIKYEKSPYYSNEKAELFIVKPKIKLKQLKTSAKIVFIITKSKKYLTLPNCFSLTSEKGKKIITLIIN